jgi:uncharacterized protein
MQDEAQPKQEKPALNPVRSAVMLVCVAAFGLGRLWQVSLPALLLTLAGAMAVLALLYEARSLRAQLVSCPRDVLFALALGILVYMLLSWGRRVVPDLTPMSGLWLGRLAARASSVPLWVAGAVGALVLVPAEELFWRGFAQRRLVARLGPLAGVSVATAACGVFWTAALDPLVGCAAALTGLVFGIMAVRARSLAPAVAGHALTWLLAVAVMPLY